MDQALSIIRGGKADNPELGIILRVLLVALVIYMYFRSNPGKTLREFKEDMRAAHEIDKEIGYIRKTDLPPEPQSNKHFLYAALAFVVFLAIVLLINPSACNTF